MKSPRRREYYGPVARHPGGRPVGLRDSEAEYGGADMSTANDGGPCGTPDDTLFDRRSVHRWTRTCVGRYRPTGANSNE